MRYLLFILLFPLSLTGQIDLSGLAVANEKYYAEIGGSMEYEYKSFIGEIQATTGFEDYRVQLKTGLSPFKRLPFRLSIFPAVLEQRFNESDFNVFSQIQFEQPYKNIGFRGSVMYRGDNDFGFQAGLRYTILSSNNVDYAFSKQQIVGTALSFVGGFIHGMREKYHADPRVFEKAFGASPESFFGSESWKRKYDANGNERRFYTSFSDFWHVSEWVSKGAIMAGTTVLITYKHCNKHNTNTCSCSKKNWKRIGLDLITSFAVSSLGAWTGYGSMNWLSRR